MSWFMRIGPVKSDGMVTVYYGIHGADAYDREVTEDIGRMLSRAMEAGSEQRAREIRQALGLKQ